MPLENAEVDAQLSGSTFYGTPTVVGGVYYGSGNVGSLPAYVQSIQTDVSGAQYITSTGSLPVAVGNFPAVQAVSGAIGILTGIVQVWSEGALPVSGTVSVQGAAAGTLAPVQIWSEGAIGISGSTTLNVAEQNQLKVSNFPATQNVSGTVSAQGGTAGSLAPIQIWSEGQIGVSGSLTVTPAVTQTAQNVSSSSGVRVWNDVPVGVSGTVSVQGAPAGTLAPIQIWSEGQIGVSGSFSLGGQIGVNNFPATQNVSGTVTANVTFPVNQQVWIAEPVGISGTVTANIGTAPQLQVSNFPATQNVSGTVTAQGGTAGSVAPVQVWSEGNVGVSGSVSISNFPATQNVSASLPPDASFATQAITAQDTNSTTNAGANGASYITGTPTGGSAATFSISNMQSAVIQVTGTWTGTLTLETSVDGGTTWFNHGVKQNATGYVSAAFTGNFIGSLNTAAATHTRVRATAAWTGSATVLVRESATSVEDYFITNALTLRDATTQSITNTIKAASTAAAATDTALVVALSPTSPVNGAAAGAAAPVQMWNEGLVGVSGTVTLGSQVQVSNFPATQNVSGSITVGAWAANQTGSVTVQGAPGGYLAPVQVWSEGNVGVSGSVSVSNFPATQVVAGATAGSAAPVQIWSEGQIGVSGSFSIGGQIGVNNFPATQNVSGTVGINNFPATQSVSGTLGFLSGTVQVWSEGPLPVSGTVTVQGGTAGSLAPVQVWSEGNVGVSGSVTVGSWAANQTGSVTVQGAPGGYLAPVQVWSEGNVGVSGTVTANLGSQVQVSNFPATQNVSGSVTVGSWANNVTGSVSVQGAPAGYLAPVQIWSEGQIGVSGSFSLGGQVGVNNFPATQNVSGSITVGTWGTNVTASIQGVPGSIPVQVWIAETVGISGSISAVPGVTQTAQNVSSSSGVRVWNDVSVGVTGTVSVQGAVAGTLAPIQIWSEGQIGVSGSFSIGGQVGVNNFPATQNVSGSITVGAWGANVTASIQGVPGGIPTQIWAAEPIGVSGVLGVVAGTVQVWSEGPLPVSGTVTSIIGNWPAVLGVSGTSQFQVSNFPATQSVTGTLGFLSGTVQVWSEGPLPISGTVQVWSEGPLPISGSVSLLPTTTAANAATFTGSMGQLPGGTVPCVIKASAGTLFKVWVTNRSTSSVYLQLFNSTTQPAVNAVPLAAYQVFSGSISGGNPAVFPNDIVFDASPFGINFSSGIALGLSSLNTKYQPVSNVGSGIGSSWDFSAMYI